MESAQGSEFSEVELVARDAEVFDDVGNDTARHVARMPGERDQSVRSEGVGVVAMTARSAQEFAANFAESSLQLTAVPRGVFAHGSGGEDKFVAESRWNGSPGFEQRLQMGFGGPLEAERGFAAVAPVRMAAGQQRRFGDPNAVLILSQLHLRERNNHCAPTIARSAFRVKEVSDA